MTSVALQPVFPDSQNINNDNDALFDSLVRQYAKDLYRYAYWLVGCKHVAEDLVQETMLRAWNSIHRLNDAKAVKSWLFTIVRRENARRFERKQLEFSEHPLQELEQAHPGYDTSTEAFVLRQALQQLSPEYREPLLLQIIDGYSQTEIAKHLGISTAGAGTRLFRARQKLREVLI